MGEMVTQHPRHFDACTRLDVSGALCDDVLRVHVLGVARRQGIGQAKYQIDILGENRAGHYSALPNPARNCNASVRPK